MNPYEQTSGSNDLAIANGVDTTVISTIPGAYQDQLFTIILVNTGTVPLIVKFLDINGQAKIIRINNNAPGITKDFVPYETIASGISAQGVGGAGLLSYDVYATQTKRTSNPTLFAEQTVPEQTTPEPEPLLIKEYIV